MSIQSICVFCGSSLGQRAAYRTAAREMGQLMAKRGLTLVYGGGNIGLMGVIADAVMKTGGAVIGVIPKSLQDRELAHQGITKLHIVESMHDRKAFMAELADAFVALPGGYGTLEELCEIVTWSQLGFHRKPCGMLNVDGYYDGLIRQFEHGVGERFIREEHRQLVVSSDDPVDLLDRIQAAR